MKLPIQFCMKIKIIKRLFSSRKHILQNIFNIIFCIIFVLMRVCFEDVYGAEASDNTSEICSISLISSILFKDFRQKVRISPFYCLTWTKYIFFVFVFAWYDFTTLHIILLYWKYDYFKISMIFLTININAKFR